MSTIYLIRHGESETNVGLACALPERASLTLQGVTQAKQAATYLRSHASPDLIVTSRYRRTKESASFTKTLFPGVPITQWEVQEFTYLASLHHEKSTQEQRKPLVELYWEMMDPDFVDGHGSESFKDFAKRGYKLLKELKNSKQEIAIFSHEQFITVLLWLIDTNINPKYIDSHAMHAFKQYLTHHRIPNGGIIHLQYRRHQDKWLYKYITQHLEQPLEVQHKLPSWEMLVGRV